MDRASQILAQGIPPGMPKPYRAHEIVAMPLALPSIIVLAHDT
jgi:hypothetical protein